MHTDNKEPAPYSLVNQLDSQQEPVQPGVEADQPVRPFQMPPRGGQAGAIGTFC